MNLLLPFACAAALALACVPSFGRKQENYPSNIGGLGKTAGVRPLNGVILVKQEGKMK